MEAERVKIFDTTLRDGEQSPGITLNTAEKLEIATQLERLHVDVIEAGFPASSPGELEAVKEISRRVRIPVICALARANASDIRIAAEAVREAERPRIHTFISTSDIHITHQLQATRADVLGMARASVAQAWELCEDVEFSPMDATRADVEFTAEVCAVAIEEGASTINIPDTVGYATPAAFTTYIERLYELVPGLDTCTLSVHCHDDLGLAVANSYAGVLAGARQVECTINGIGERAGNCSLEELVMLLRTHGPDHGLATEVSTRHLTQTSRMISRLTGYPVPPNKAIVGRNAFAHESGIHQDGVLKERSTYEIMDPRDVGLESNEIVLGKHSGRRALREALTKLGIELDGAALNSCFQRFKEIADRKGELSASDIEALALDQLGTGSSRQLVLRWFEVSTDSLGNHSAELTIDADGETLWHEGSGDGPVAAMIDAINSALGIDGRLLSFELSSVDRGSQALAEARVEVEIDGERLRGHALSPSVVEAAAQAYLRTVSPRSGSRA